MDLLCASQVKLAVLHIKHVLNLNIQSTFSSSLVFAVEEYFM